MIKIVDLATNTVLPTPFLDITAIVGQGQGTGILGMTFDPDYAVNGHFFVSYTTDGTEFSTMAYPTSGALRSALIRTSPIQGAK